MVDCLAGEEVHEDMPLPPTGQPIAAETSVLGGVLWAYACFKTNSGAFVCLKTETRMPRGACIWSMHLEQRSTLHGNFYSSMPENGSEAGPEPEDFNSPTWFGICPSLLIWVIGPRSSLEAIVR
jgi:hypothetical protein